MDNQQIIDLQNRLDSLEGQVKELKDWREKKRVQQIELPLDPESVGVLSEYFVRVVDQFTYLGGVSDNAFPIYVGEQNGQQFEMYGMSLVRCTAEPSTDFITIIDRGATPTTGLPRNKFFNDDTVVFFTTNTMPDGLSGQGLVTYYVVNASSDGYTFQVSTSQGGSEVDIDSSGVGNLYLYRI